MDHDFWRNKWETNQIGFHQTDGNPLLVEHFPALALAAGARVFVPLCGKTRDISWLRDNDCTVVGAELSEIAVQDLFAEMGLRPDIQQQGNLKCYSSSGVDIFVGDIFDLAKAMLGPVNAIFDRAALVALPRNLRQRYTLHLTQVTGGAPQLLITFVYDQTQMTGPPFSIPEAEVTAHYAAGYTIQELETQDVQGGFKGVIPAAETVWHLTPV